MKDLEKRAVKKHWTDLLNNLNTEYGLLDHLFSHERSTGIDWETYEKIRAVPVRYDRVERLLLKLLKTSSLESFIDALNVKGSYSHLAHMILTTYRKLEGSHTPANEGQVAFARDGIASSSVEGSIPTRGRSPDTNSRRTRRRYLKMCAPLSLPRLPHPLDDVKDVGKLPARAPTGAGKRRRRRSTEDRMLRDVAGTARRGRHGLTRRQGVSALSRLSGDQADCIWDGDFRRPRNPPRQC